MVFAEIEISVVGAALRASCMAGAMSNKDIMDTSLQSGLVLRSFGITDNDYSLFIFLS